MASKGAVSTSKKPFSPATGIERRFAWIASIPHGSTRELGLSNAIRSLAQDAGLETIQDSLGNLLVRKSASPGYEDRPAVILQAHMDMVCTKTPESRHDFHIDPLTLMEEDGWLTADGTTLGSDDGYGVAYMLEILFDESAEHPDLECLFTVQEEIGLIGAAAVDPSIIRARRMISMDSGGENVIVVSTNGGRRVSLTLPLDATAPQGQSYRLTVSGLTGGHSAGEIHRGRANAIKLLGHVLYNLPNTAVHEFGGGEATNAIPRDAWAVITTQDAPEKFEEVRNRFIRMYRAADPNIDLTLEPAARPEGTAYDAKPLAGILTALHDGIRRMDPERGGVVALSSNIGILSQEDGCARIQCMIRSENNENCEMLTEQLLSEANAFGAKAHTDSDYPGMEYNPDSAMRALLGEIIKEQLGKEIEERSSHGGMEIGYFSRRVPGLDIVTLGPIQEGCHSPAERLNLESFNRTFEILKEMLKRIGK